jgi:ATP-dependent helicase YprA (DUF1998 family)
VLAETRTSGPKRRTRAIVVYPMNALANSQMEELGKFIGQVAWRPPVTFARYTGQEDADERKRVADEPPDILLTNFMMLELLMTRQDESTGASSDNCAGLRFLVLDELHTYRGRQGADVALLVRRVRERLQPEKLLQCIGTSATMASEGSLEDKSRVVAGVASKLFATPIRKATSSSRRSSASPTLWPARTRSRQTSEPRSMPASAEITNEALGEAPARDLGRDPARHDSFSEGRPTLGPREAR